MKNYFLGLVAIIIAIGAAAYTKPGKGLKPVITHPFHYTLSTFAKADVENNSKWAPGAGSGCSGLAVKACEIQVDQDYTELVEGVRVLKTSGMVLSITASSVNAVDYRPNTSAAIPSKIDKQ